MNYEFSENGKQLIFSTKPEKKDSLDKTNYGVFIVNTSNFIQKQLVDTIGEFKQFAFDDSANKLAFVGSTDDEKKENKNYFLYYSAIPSQQDVKKNRSCRIEKRLVCI